MQAPLRLVEQVTRRLGFEQAGFDLIQADDHWYFLEFNLMFGNQALTARRISVAEPIHDSPLSRLHTPPISPSQLPQAV